MALSKAKLTKLTKDELVQMVLDLRKDLKVSQARGSNYSESNTRLTWDLKKLNKEYNNLNEMNQLHLDRMLEFESEKSRLEEGIINIVKKMA